MILKRKYPDADIHYLRDLAFIPPAEVYSMLLSVPEYTTREEILELLPDNKNRILKIFDNHADPGKYDLRSVALFGISECARSRKCLDLMLDGDYAHLGRMMQVSHDGDRLPGQEITDELLKS